MSVQPSIDQSNKQSLSLEEATVIGAGNDNWIIQSDSGTYRARQAVSCLVLPEIGDRVLSAALSSGESSILAILRRDSSDSTQLRFPGSVDIQAADSVRIVANDNIDALCAGKMNLDAHELTQHATDSHAIFERCNVTATEATHSFKKFKLLASYLETVSDTSRAVMKHSFRMISAFESVSAGDLMHKIRNRFSVQSRQAAMLADEDARVNGKRVHLG